MFFFNADAKITPEKKNSYIVYMKEGNNITDALNLIRSRFADGFI